MELVRRKSCRAILLTPENEVLLIKVGTTMEGWIGWITPGGGLDEGEAEEAGLRRELQEEVGMDEFEVTGKIWTRSHEFVWNGRQIYSDEVFYLIRSEKFEPESRHLTEIEKAEFKEMRWWPVEAMEKSGERFAPAKLVHYLRYLISYGVPEEAIPVGNDSDYRRNN